jgi:hypothetical protein
MKNKHSQIVVVIAAAFCTSAICGKAQGFQNLDFESDLGSPINGNNDDPGAFYNLPGWKVSTVGDPGGASSGGVYYNYTITDGTDAYIIPAGGYDVMTGEAIDPLQGNQSLALYASGLNGALASISISQTGTIPEGENSVSFLLGYFGTYDLTPSQNPLTYFSLSINGNYVPLAVTSVNGQVLTVAGNISQWAGQTVTLSIANGPLSDGAEAFGVIDDIAFSPQVVAVPEPSTFAPAAIAGCFGWLLTIRQRKLNNRSR